MSASTTSYTDNALTSDETYFYRVFATNAGGNSPYSNTSYAITATVVPNAPSNLLAVGSTGSATLNWTDNSTNENQFDIERSTDDINFSQIGAVNLNITTYTDASLSAGLYYYRVRAQNIIGYSSYSNVASASAQ